MTGSGSTIVAVGSDNPPAYLSEPQHEVGVHSMRWGSKSVGVN